MSSLVDTCSRRRDARLGSGTSPSEACNAALNRWLQKLGEVHAEALQAKSSLIHLRNILAHNAALEHPILARVRSQDLLAFVVHAQILTARMVVMYLYRAPLPLGGQTCRDQGAGFRHTAARPPRKGMGSAPSSLCVVCARRGRQFSERSRCVVRACSGDCLT